MPLLPPEIQSAFDAATPVAASTSAAEASLLLANRVMETIKTYVPAQRRYVTDGHPEMGAMHWQDTWTALLRELDATLLDGEQRAQAFATVAAIYPNSFTPAGLEATYLAIYAAVSKLAVATAQTIDADLTAIEEAFHSLWS